MVLMILYRRLRVYGTTTTHTHGKALLRGRRAGWSYLNPSRRRLCSARAISLLLLLLFFSLVDMISRRRLARKHEEKKNHSLA